MTIPLSDRPINILETLIKEPLRTRIRTTLVTDLSRKIPFCSKETPEGMERIRAAINKLIVDDEKNFDQTLKETEAKSD
jgi:hypothetical protein